MNVNSENERIRGWELGMRDWMHATNHRNCLSKKRRKRMDNRERTQKGVGRLFGKEQGSR
jgi:hypothetical protein